MAARLRSMRSLSTTAAVLIGGVLALLLIVYVFAGGSGPVDRAPHCTSAQALDLVKTELFRRAAAMRGSNDGAFDNVERHSVVRAASRLVRRHHSGSDEVTCTGTLALDLPPGAAAAGGRRTLAADVQYDLAPASNGTARLVSLSKAEDITAPLATVSNAERDTGQQIAPTPQVSQTQPAAPAATAPARPRAAPPSAPGAPSAPRAHVEAPAPPTPTPAKKPSPPKKPEPAAHPKPPPAPHESAMTNPSFNCRYARTRGEIAVCRNPVLARLDREMSSEYYKAVAAATPGQKAMLERSRNRFLAYRDSCRSDACVADTYRGRMREISDIMAGGW